MVRITEEREIEGCAGVIFCYYLMRCRHFPDCGICEVRKRKQLYSFFIMLGKRNPPPARFYAAVPRDSRLQLAITIVRVMHHMAAPSDTLDPFFQPHSSTFIL